MNYNLNDAQRLWLREVERRTTNGETIDLDQLRIDLRDELPRDFMPSMIDSRFYHQGRITPLGLYEIDPNNKKFEDTNRFVRCVRDQILKTPRPVAVSAAEVATQLGLTLPLSMIRSRGRFNYAA